MFFVCSPQEGICDEDEAGVDKILISGRRQSTPFGEEFIEQQVDVNRLRSGRNLLNSKLTSIDSVRGGIY